MFHAITLFRALGVVETVSCSHKIARDAPDTLKAHAFADNSDTVPLSLEEIFIYELGGADYAVKNILFS